MRGWPNSASGRGNKTGVAPVVTLLLQPADGEQQLGGQPWWRCSVTLALVGRFGVVGRRQVPRRDTDRLHGQRLGREAQIGQHLSA